MKMKLKDLIYNPEFISETDAMQYWFGYKFKDEAVIGHTKTLLKRMKKLLENDKRGIVNPNALFFFVNHKENGINGFWNPFDMIYCTGYHGENICIVPRRPDKVAIMTIDKEGEDRITVEGKWIDIVNYFKGK